MSKLRLKWTGPDATTAAKASSRRPLPTSVLGRSVINLRVATGILSASSLISASAYALDFSFYGRQPLNTPGAKVEIKAGVEPGIPVLFDVSSPGQTILRPARSNEKTNSLRPIYRFEWKADKSARFYELVDPDELDRLSRQNAIDTASSDGKEYELKAIQKFFEGAKILQKCLPPSKPFRGLVTAYFVVEEDGNRGQTIVLPEGSFSECIIESASKTNYPLPPHRFTAKADVNVTK